jgi:hypothetical protein
VSLQAGRAVTRPAADQDMQDNFQLTGFLLRDMLEQRGQGYSDTSESFINAVIRHRASPDPKQLLG